MDKKFLVMVYALWFSILLEGYGCFLMGIFNRKWRNKVKKAIILLVMLMVFGGYSQRVEAKEGTYFQFKAKVFNDIAGDFYDIKANLIYWASKKDPDVPSTNLKGRVGLHFDYIGGPTYYLFFPIERARLIAAIDKYFKWEKKATAKGVLIEKTIAKVAPRVVWGFGSGLYFSDANSNYSDIRTIRHRKEVLSVGFFSRSKTKHELTLLCEEVSGLYSVYNTIEHKPETIYLDYDQVKALRANITDEAIRAALAKIKKEKEAIDADFN